MLEKAIQVLKSFEADKEAVLSTQSMGKIEKRPGDKQISKELRGGYISGSVASSISQEKLDQIMKKMEEQKIEADLQIPLETGGPFNNYGQIDNVLDEGKTVLAHKPGQVLLVDVWATWCGPCQKPMEHNQKMLTEYEERWKDKVRIVGVSVDESKEVIKTRVEQKNWNKIVHLTLLGWKGEHSLIKDFNIQGIPFVCLVDKFGKINYIGHPMEISLEKRINELLDQEKEGEKKEAAPAAAPQEVSSEEELNKLIESFEKEKIKDIFKDVELLCFTFALKKTWEKGKFETKLNIKAFVLEDDQNGFEKAKDFFGNKKGVEVNIQKVKYEKVPFEENPKCWKCENPLEFPYYWLRWEQGNKFGCRKCVQAPSKQEGHHYEYEKNSILLMDKIEKLPIKKMGENIQPSDISKVEEANQFGCNCCGKCPQNIGEARYLCLGCRADPNFYGDHVDVCDKCMELVIQKDEKALEGLKEDKYQPQYPFLRILYHVKGYYKY